MSGRPQQPVHGLDDGTSLDRALGCALGLWGFGLIAFLTVLARVEQITVESVAVYLSLGPVLAGGYVVGSRTRRMPGFVLFSVIVWTSLLGTVSSFYYVAAPMTTVALCTAFVSWLGTRVAPLYAVGTVLGLLVSGVVQDDPAIVDRTIVTAVAIAFAVVIVGRSSDSSRTAHHDREILLERLAHDSRHDELTDVGNRKRLIEQTHVALESTDTATVALALIDLDGFKIINDTYGHGVGDEVLRVVARRLSDAVDPNDTVVRIGGDEFAVLFSGREIDHDMAVRLIETICDDDVRIDDLTIGLKISLGVAVEDRSTTSLEQLLATADDEMYEQKRSRRFHQHGTLIL